ncbi:MAG TPA: FAD-dependent oxidoreductase, partial [Gemmatimonadales bacterium]|nr:FAD-dependent oxidoreductase [Gemmatimonadales bacterium]
LVSWELDAELGALRELIGEEAAVRAYRASLGAVGTLERLIRKLPDDCGFTRRPSLYLASSRRDVRRLQREAELRARHGFPSEYWDKKRMTASLSFRAPGAIRSSGSAELDPYRLTHALLARAAGRGARVFDRTEVIREDFARGAVTLKTGRGFFIRARRVVMALGYEIPRPLRRDLVRLSSTYALVSEPVAEWTGWEDRCLIWESARPYHYLRTTGDGRALIGGEDEPFRDPGRRDRMLPRKIERLSRRLAAMLPDLQAEPAFGWTGTFGSTADGLPYIGESAEAPGRIFALGYGGNGITFGAIAAGVVLGLCLGKPPEDTRLYRLDR